MSSNSTRNSGTNQLTVDTDTSKIFLGDNETVRGNYVNNSSYSPITLSPGTVMGRVGSTGVLVPFQSDASDGSQFIVGVLLNTLVLDSAASAPGAIVVTGRVAQDKLIFVKPGDGLDSIVSNQRVRDKIGRETVGILLTPSDELTHYDN